ncbi:hypothetical protein [Microviridae sp.]|nr:hypothetical protein [Microviridae sp.]
MRQISRTPRNYVMTESDFETLTGPSKTVPNMTLPLKELLNRFTRGQSVATLSPVYNGEEELPDFEYMDTMEKLDYARDIRRGITQRQDEMSQAAAAAQEAAKMKPNNPETEDFEEPIILDAPES